MLNAIQYLSYLIAGAFYYLIIAAIMSVAAGFSSLGLSLLFLPLLLGGYAPGLSLIAPRLAGGVAGIITLAFLILGIFSSLAGAAGINDFIFFAPAAAVIAVSVYVLFGDGVPAWSTQRLRGKVLLGVIRLCPAILATGLLVLILVWLFGFQPAT